MLMGVIAAQYTAPVFPWMRMSNATVTQNQIASTPTSYYTLAGWMSINSGMAKSTTIISTVPANYNYVFYTPFMGTGYTSSTATTIVPTPTEYNTGTP